MRRSVYMTWKQCEKLGAVVFYLLPAMKTLSFLFYFFSSRFFVKFLEKIMCE